MVGAVTGVSCVDADCFPRGAAMTMSEPSQVRSERWRGRVRRLRAQSGRALLFLAGVAAALVTLLFYHVLVPPPPQLTTSDVNASIAHAMASATPPPAYSASVYQVIRPSLVLVQ